MLILCPNLPYIRHFTGLRHSMTWWEWSPYMKQRLLDFESSKEKRNLAWGRRRKRISTQRFPITRKKRGMIPLLSNWKKRISEIPYYLPLLIPFPHAITWAVRFGKLSLPYYTKHANESPIQPKFKPNLLEFLSSLKTKKKFKKKKNLSDLRY